MRYEDEAPSYGQKAKGENEKMRTQNNKTKAVTITVSIIMILGIMTPSLILPSVNAGSVDQITAPIRPLPPALSAADNQAIINAALSIPELKNWSNGWQYVNTGFIGTNNPVVKWEYAIVTLKAPSKSAPVACDVDWSAWIKIDLATKKVIAADYPSMNSHVCHGITGANGANHGYSIATQDDVIGSSYYGNYAEIKSPSFLSTVYNHLSGGYITQLLNAEWNSGTGCSDPYCIEQVGWLLTAATGCSGCGISANHNYIAYVDESTYNDQHLRDTGLSWVNGQTLASSISCSGSMQTITTTYGSQLFSQITKIPCTSPQDNFQYDNSVFLENSDTLASSNWSSDITGTVSATNAFEFNSLGGSSQWGASSNKDTTCVVPHSYTTSTVITSGNLKLGGTATWGNLSNEPVGC